MAASNYRRIFKSVLLFEEKRKMQIRP